MTADKMTADKMTVDRMTCRQFQGKSKPVMLTHVTSK
jgi:hypothetical protein